LVKATDALRASEGNLAKASRGNRRGDQQTNRALASCATSRAQDLEAVQQHARARHRVALTALLIARF